MDHLIKHGIALNLIFLNRIPVGKGTQANPIPELIHVINMGHPLAVDISKQDDALHLAHVKSELADRLLTLGIDLMGLFLERLGDVRPVHSGKPFKVFIHIGLVKTHRDHIL